MKLPLSCCYDLRLNAGRCIRDQHGYGAYRGALATPIACMHTLLLCKEDGTKPRIEMVCYGLLPI